MAVSTTSLLLWHFSGVCPRPQAPAIRVTVLCGLWGSPPPRIPVKPTCHLRGSTASRSNAHEDAWLLPFCSEVPNLTDRDMLFIAPHLQLSKPHSSLILMASASQLASRSSLHSSANMQIGSLCVHLKMTCRLLSLAFTYRHVSRTPVSLPCFFLIAPPDYILTSGGCSWRLSFLSLFPCF